MKDLLLLEICKAPKQVVLKTAEGHIFLLMAGTYWKNQVSNQALKHKRSLNFCFLMRTYIWGKALRLNHTLSLDLHAFIYSDN